MTREEAIEVLKANYPSKCFEQLREAVDMAIKALEQEPCEDCISREDTLKAMIEQLGIRNEDYLIPAEATLYKIVKNMPPVTPQPKTGHWIVDELFEDEWSYRCSECGETYLFWLDKHETPKDYGYDFCPKCRAKMVEPQESENKKEESEKEKYRLLLAFMSGLISNKEEREKALDYIEDMMLKE